MVYGNQAMKSFVFAILFLTVFSCARHPPVIYPISDKTGDPLPQITDIYLSGSWQLVHTIYAETPDGKTNVMTGITIIKHHPLKIECVLMTLEGFVIFDGGFDKHPVVNRAVPPFDKTEFAQGLIDDIRLIFTRPGGQLYQSGLLETKAPIYRFQNKDGRMMTDITFYPDHTWQITRYNNHKLSRTVSVSFNDGAPEGPPFIPDKIILTAHGLLGYRLSLNLVEAVRLTP